MEKLWIDDIQIEEIPQDIGYLINIKRLCAYKNNPKTISKSFFNITRLERVNFSTTKMMSLSDRIGYLKNLQILDLNHNELTMLPIQLGN